VDVNAESSALPARTLAWGRELDTRLHIGAGDGNRTRTISLGSTPIGAAMLRDLRRCLSASSRI